MMNIQSIPSQAVGDIRREHEALRESLGHIQHVMAGSEVSGHEIAALLLGLHAALGVHFANEEHLGFFDEITSHAPRLAAQANQLCSEHHELLRTALELAQLASVGAGKGAARRELISCFHTFSKQLMHHEGGENSLLQQAYQEDIGTND